MNLYWFINFNLTGPAGSQPQKLEQVSFGIAPSLLGIQLWTTFFIIIIIIQDSRLNVTHTPVNFYLATFEAFLQPLSQKTGKNANSTALFSSTTTNLGTAGAPPDLLFRTMWTL